MRKYIVIGVCMGAYLLSMSACSSRNGCPGKITYKAATEKANKLA